MASIKLHAFKGTNWGDESCDFRGDKFIGHAQGDEHRTLFEIDPADEATVEIALAEGPRLNGLLKVFFEKATPADAMQLLGGGHIGLRFGVWDE